MPQINPTSDMIGHVLIFSELRDSVTRGKDTGMSHIVPRIK